MDESKQTKLANKIGEAVLTPHREAGLLERAHQSEQNSQVITESLARFGQPEVGLPSDVLVSFNLLSPTSFEPSPGQTMTYRPSLLKAALLSLATMSIPLRLASIGLVTLIVVGGSVATYNLVYEHGKQQPTKTVAVVLSKPVVKAPTAPTIPLFQKPASQSTTPVTYNPPPPPPPPPSLPVVAGKNTSYNLGVLVIKYFPLTSDGQNINIAVTGDVGDSYSVIKQKTIDITNNLLTYLPKASQYLGYKYGGDQPSLNYHVVATFEHDVAVPINSTLHPVYTTYPDYYGIMGSHNICSYVDSQGVHEVWMFAYQGPNQPSKNNQPYLGIEESKMSGPYGDISNSYEWNDMPHCQHTYVVYTYNYGRGTAEAAHSWGHQIEAEMKAVNPTLFGLFQGPNWPQTLGVTGRCGSVHNPPNARFEYDWANSAPQASDCEDWQPDGLGSTTQVSCVMWGCDDVSDTNNAQLNWQVWMWQNLPGMNNAKTYQGKQLRNWWDVHGEFDTVMGSSKHLTL